MLASIPTRNERFFLTRVLFGRAGTRCYGQRSAGLPRTISRSTAPAILSGSDEPRGRLCRAICDHAAHAHHGGARCIRGKAIKTTTPGKAAPCTQGHVNRQFHAPAPNRLRVFAYTYQHLERLRLWGPQSRLGLFEQFCQRSPSGFSSPPSASHPPSLGQAAYGSSGKIGRRVRL